MKSLEDELKLIDSDLKKDLKNPSLLHKKALILKDMNDFTQSYEFFNASLDIEFNQKVADDKIDMISQWMYKSKNIEGLDEILDDIGKYDESVEILSLKAKILSRMGRRIESQKCWYRAFGQEDKIKDLDRQIEFIKSRTDEVFVNVTGTRYYEGYEAFHEGMILTLKKDHFNAYDRDAICVCDGDVKLGHVANSEGTLTDFTKSASEIQELFEEEITAEFMFFYLENYLIARLML